MPNAYDEMLALGLRSRIRIDCEVLNQQSKTTLKLLIKMYVVLVS